MKKLQYLLLSSFIILMLSSCNEEMTEPLTSTSEDGDLKITVQGKRYVSSDPFVASVIATFNGEDLTATTEVYAEYLTEENVQFIWSGDRKCTVIFTHRDGKTATVPVVIE